MINCSREKKKKKKKVKKTCFSLIKMVLGIFSVSVCKNRKSKIFWTSKIFSITPVMGCYLKALFLEQILKELFHLPSLGLTLY